jgi:hypothetical protein
MSCMTGIRVTAPPVLIITFFFLIALSIINNYFGPYKFVYGQPNQMNAKITNSLNIESIPSKKVHVGDIDIAYKSFGKGADLLLISGSGLVMDAWQPSILRPLKKSYSNYI